MKVVKLTFLNTCTPLYLPLFPSSWRRRGPKNKDQIEDITILSHCLQIILVYHTVQYVLYMVHLHVN